MKIKSPKQEIYKYTAESFDQYIQFIQKECSEKYILFRGQRENAKLHRPLLPMIARIGLKGNKILAAEKRIFEDFKKRALPYIEKNIPKTDWEWLTLAQHHGLPTRLLDWTRNPLAALWFVVHKSPRDLKTYGIVWIFKPEDKDVIDFSKDKKPFAIKRTKVFEPSHIARRITAQSACFTVHKYLDNESTFIPLDRNINYMHKLMKVVIPGEKFAELKRQLDRCGINDVTLFTDLDNLCKYIAWRELQ